MEIIKWNWWFDSGLGVPENALLWDDGTPVLWDDGTFVLWE